MSSTNFKVYIQREKGQFADDFLFAAYIGFRKRQITIKFFENIDLVPVSKFNIIIGSMEVTKIYLKKLGITIPPPLNVPDELKLLSKRATYNTTLGDVRNYDENQFPLFIKPIDKTSANNFIPGPVKNKKDFSCYYSKFNNDLEVQISSVINFNSEYRCFVLEGKLIGIKHYIDDFKLFPDIDYIYKCIATYKSSPIAYTLDVGITDKGETLLVECNDAWSIGNYGLDAVEYVKLLLKRWHQIMGFNI